MGGINHQPTNRSSEQITVYGARALTNAMAELMQGNCRIEDVIIASSALKFGDAKDNLIAAVARFGASRDSLTEVRARIDEMLELLDRSDYVPFATNSIDTDRLVAAFIANGFLPEANAVHVSAEIFKQSGFNSTFHHLRQLNDDAGANLDALSRLTNSMVDGPVATQGYFWFLVETNSMPWRQAFARALTSMNTLINSWSTSALLSTELHLVGTGMPSLTAAPANTEVRSLV